MDYSIIIHHNLDKEEKITESEWVNIIHKCILPIRKPKDNCFYFPHKKHDVKSQNHKVMYNSSETFSHQWAAVNMKYPRLLLLHTSFWSPFFSLCTPLIPCESTLHCQPDKKQPYPIVLFGVGV